ncbi:MAG: PAS domain-containing protein [Betaproteobacteria bacterium]|nr:PAS domain-containing protein [Betaproteobacteria bacterium]
MTTIVLRETTLSGESQDRAQRILALLNLYRLGCGGLFLIIAAAADLGMFPVKDFAVFATIAVAYLALGIGIYWRLRDRQEIAPRTLAGLIALDSVLIALLSQSAGGISHSLGIVLYPTLAGYGWLVRDRLALLFAAVPSVVLLTGDFLHILQTRSDSASIFQTGLIGLGFFATSVLGILLGRYNQASEQLAAKRGVDLASLEQVNQLIIQDMQDGVLVVDGESLVRGHNAQAERLLGIYGKTRDGVPLSRFSPALASYWADWRQYGWKEEKPLAVQGTQRLLRVRLMPVGADRAAGAIVFLEDLGRAQAQAQQLKLAALGRLTANIAHEVRNPLSAINHATELLQENPGLPETESRLLGIIHTNATRINRIVSDVLELNRRDRIQTESFDLEPFLSALIEELTQVEGITPGGVLVSVLGGPRIRFDRGHLNQILWNLLRNAWQHGRQREGSIRVAARPGYSAGHVILEVQDDGEGVPAANRGQLFEPFFTTRPGGTGLGLYVARQLAEANTASLELVDRNGPGALFRILAQSGESK